MVKNRSRLKPDRFFFYNHERFIMTWKQITQLEPRLQDLAKEIKEHAKANKRAPKYCANKHWYGRCDTGLSYKDRMSELVGYGADVPAIATMEAYDIAYDYLYNLLPDCTCNGGIC